MNWEIQEQTRLQKMRNGRMERAARLSEQEGRQGAVENRAFPLNAQTASVKSVIKLNQQKGFHFKRGVQ